MVCLALRDLPKKLEGTALGICDPEFFTSGRARELKQRGLKIVWSNEMMFPFKGEADAVLAGIIDRALLVSSFQERTLNGLYEGIQTRITGNYIDPDEYRPRERQNTIFTLGRLSRPSPEKFSLDFPVFYEELGLNEVRYRVMAWNQDLQKRYRWHRFGPQWDLVPAYKETALDFLWSLDLFVYTVSHTFKESWGRAVVEAMLTGCLPIVPAGHEFERFVKHGITGFICHEFRDFQECVRELYSNYRLRKKLALDAAVYARETLCNPEKHRPIWIQALTF